MRRYDPSPGNAVLGCASSALRPRALITAPRQAWGLATWLACATLERVSAKLPLAYGFAGVRLLPRPCSMPTLPSVQSWPKNVVAALAMTGTLTAGVAGGFAARTLHLPLPWLLGALAATMAMSLRSEEHTSELQSPCNLVC